MQRECAGARGRARRAAAGRLATAAVVGSLFVASPARAQFDWLDHADLRATGTVTTGATNDVLVRPRELIDPEPDGFTILSPGLQMLQLSGKIIHQLSYTFSGVVYFTHPNLDAFANELSYLGLIRLEPTVRLLLGGTFTQTYARTLNLLLSPGPGQQLGARTATGRNYISSSVEQRTIWEASRPWTVNQGVQLGSAVPTTGGRPSVTASASFGARYRFRSHALGVSTDLLYFLGRSTPAVGGINSSHQLQQTIVGEWLWDFGRGHWTLGVQAGGVLATVLGGGADLFGQPVGNASLSYRHPYGTVRIGGGRSVQPNLLLGTNYIRDSGYLGFGIRFDQRERWRLSGGGSYEHMRAVGTRPQTIHYAQASASLSWRAHEMLDVGLDYRFTLQLGRNPILGTNPDGSLDIDRRATGTLHQQVVLLRTTFYYPGRAKGYRRIELRPPKRVDQKSWEELFSSKPGQRGQ